MQIITNIPFRYGSMPRSGASLNAMQLPRTLAGAVTKPVHVFKWDCVGGMNGSTKKVVPLRCCEGKIFSILGELRECTQTPFVEYFRLRFHLVAFCRNGIVSICLLFAKRPEKEFDLAKLLREISSFNYIL